MSRDATRANYDRLSRWYDSFSSSERRFTETGLRLLDPKPDEAILEIGFGTGHALAALAQTARVWGIDLSPGMLTVTEHRLRRAGLLDRVTLQLGDATSLPFPDEMFDAAFMSFTLELFPETEIPRVLAECYRVLRPGGRLGLVTLAKKDSRAVKVYEWFHAKMPQVVDCRPIRVESILMANRFDIRQVTEASIWGLPAAAVLAVKPDKPS
jgi:ubiquinone/menaquinone biosynthesis C-methylase UbiE